MQQSSQLLKDLTERLCNALPGDLNLLKNDFKKNVQAILTSAFAQLDIVTREEFDAQTKVLARTRKKITELEAQIVALEKATKK